MTDHTLAIESECLDAITDYTPHADCVLTLPSASDVAYAIAFLETQLDKVETVEAASGTVLTGYDYFSGNKITLKLTK